MVTWQRRFSVLSGIMLAALVTSASSLPLGAQTPPATGRQTGQGDGTGRSGSNTTAIDDRPVTVDADHSRLADILPDLMKSVGADFSVDNSIKNAHVTIHVTQAKFKPTLDTMMKVCDEGVTYVVEKGLYHFMALADAPKASRTPLPSSGEAPRRPGPRYNGGDPVAVAVSELFQFLTGCESAFSGKSPFPNSGPIKAGTGSVSGSRSYAEYGFLNGTISSSSYETPEMSNPSSTTYGGYGYFGPIGRGGGPIR